jgi:hypothetical protein
VWVEDWGGRWELVSGFGRGGDGAGRTMRTWARRLAALREKARVFNMKDVSEGRGVDGWETFCSSHLEHSGRGRDHIVGHELRRRREDTVVGGCCEGRWSEYHDSCSFDAAPSLVPSSEW